MTDFFNQSEQEGSAVRRSPAKAACVISSLYAPLNAATVGAFPTRESVGGKAATLLHIGRFGVSVPAGFIVTTMCFEMWLASTGASTEIMGLLQNSTLNSAYCARYVKDILSDTQVPTDISVMLEEQIAAIGWSAQTPLAIRSSADVEDGCSRSYAGIFESLLGVAGFSEVREALKKVWLSCFSARAIAYQRRFRRTRSYPRMAAIVQRMLTPTWAGTLFTMNPVTGRLDEIIVECHAGLGDVVVAGAVCPVRIRVDRAKENIGLETGDKRGREFVQSGAFRALIQVACDVERILGGLPIDIEWAAENDRIFILQARPITARPLKGEHDEAS